MNWARTRWLVAYAAVAGVVLIGSPAMAGLVIADSVADFSGTQGQNHWFYGYFNASAHGGMYHATPGGTDDFQQLPWFGLDPNNRFTEAGWQFQSSAAPWTYLSSDQAHPNGTDPWSGGSTNVHWAVRRYVTEAAGDLQIDWHLAKADVTYGNGVTGRIFVNGTEVDSAAVAYADSTGVTRSAIVVAVPQGAFVDLVLDATGTFSMPTAGGIGNGQDDLSVMTATVTVVPEPALLGIMATCGIGSLLQRNRRCIR